MPTYTFFVPGLPVAQPRQRVAVIAGKARNYAPQSAPIHTFKAAVRLAAQAAGVACYAGAVRMELRFTFPRPASKTRKRGPNMAYAKCGKPDVDNLFKGVADSLNGIAYVDDAQVYSCVVDKRVAGDGDAVGVTITVFQE